MISNIKSRWTFIFLMFLLFQTVAFAAPFPVIVRLPSTEIKKGSLGAVIQTEGEYKVAIPAKDAENNNNYIFSETDVGARSIAIIGNHFEILSFLVKHKNDYIRNDIADLPEIYIGFGKYSPRNNQYGLYPFEDFTNQFADNLSKVFTAGASNYSSFDAQTAKYTLDEYKLELTMEGFKSFVKFSFNSVQAADDIIGSMKKIKNDAVKNTLDSRYILVISYLKQNEFLQKNLIKMGEKKLAFSTILDKMQEQLFKQIKVYDDVYVWRDIFGIIKVKNNKNVYESHFEKQNMLIPEQDVNGKEKYTFSDPEIKITGTPFILIGNEIDILNFFRHRINYSFVNDMKLYPDKKIYIGISDYKYSDLFGKRKMDKLRSIKEQFGFKAKYAGRYSIQDFMNNLIKNEQGFIPDNSTKMSFEEFLKIVEAAKLRQLSSDYKYLGKYYYYIKISQHPEKGMYEIATGELPIKQILMKFYENMPLYKYSFGKQ